MCLLFLDWVLAAVDCCFRTGNLSDALILASCGGAELWAKSQERFFKMETPKRPFLNIVSGVIMNQLDTLVTESDLSNWEETLAILSTYGQSDEFPKLCIALGDRLEQSGDAQNASLCYMCALNLESSVRFWKGQLDKANKAKGSPDLLALHDFVLKVSIFLNATGSSDELPPEISQLFSKYAQVLAEQGLFATAAKYCKGSSEESKILRDRLYRSRASQRCLAVLGTAPEFPYTYDPSQPSRRVQLANRKAQEAAQQQTRQERADGGERLLLKGRGERRSGGDERGVGEDVDRAREADALLIKGTGARETEGFNGGCEEML